MRTHWWILADSLTSRLFPPLCFQLSLKVGAQVMLTKNISVQQGLANGSRGVVTAFTNSGLPIVTFISGMKQVLHHETWTIGLGAGRIASRRQVNKQH